MAYVFKINNVEYDVIVPRDGIRQVGQIIDGENSGRKENGDMERDIVGALYNYTIEVQPKMTNLKAFDDLYNQVMTPVASQLITVPSGQTYITFKAYITSAERSLSGITKDNKFIWGPMTLNFIANEIYTKP